MKKAGAIHTTNDSDSDTRYEWVGGYPIYIGKNSKPIAATSEATWTVIKLTWTDSEVTRKQVQEGIEWDDRATGWS